MCVGGRYGLFACTTSDFWHVNNRSHFSFCTVTQSVFEPVTALDTFFFFLWEDKYEGVINTLLMGSCNAQHHDQDRSVMINEQIVDGEIRTGTKPKAMDEGMKV